MKKLLLALLLSIGLVGAQQVVDRLEAALKSEDRATLKPLFDKGFSFETTYDHTGDANEAIDWILNKTIHGSFKSLIAMENSDSYVVEIKFQGTHIQLLLSISKASGLIYVGSFQTNGPAVTTTTTTQVPSTSTSTPVTSTEQWFNELLKAIRENNEKRILELLGTKYSSTLSQQQILKYLLNGYQNVHETLYTSLFYVEFDFSDKKSLRISGIRNEDHQVEVLTIELSDTKTTTSTLAPSTTTKPLVEPQQWYDELLKAIQEKNKERILELLGNEYSSTLSQQQILSYLLKGYQNVRKRYIGNNFDVEFEFSDKKTLRIHCRRHIQEKVEVQSIELRDTQTTSTLAPSTTTPYTPRGIVVFYYELREAVEAKNKSRIVQLLGKEYMSFLTEERILNIMLRDHAKMKLKNLNMTTFDIIFDWGGQFDLKIHGKKSSQRVIVITNIGLFDKPSTTTPAPTTTTPEPVKSALNFYIELRKAIGERDKSRILELLGKKYLSFLSEERILTLLLSVSDQVELKRLTKGTFDVIFDYQGQQSLKIHCNDASHIVRVTYIGLFDRSTSTTSAPTTTTSKPVTTSEEFYNALLAAMREHNKARVVQLLGEEYYSTLKKEEILAKLLANDYLHANLNHHNSKTFDVTFDYENGQTLTIHCNKGSRGIRVLLIRTTTPTTTTSTPVPTTTEVSTPVTNGEEFYIELLKAISKKNKSRIIQLIGNNYTTELTVEQILETLLRPRYNVTLRDGRRHHSVEVEFLYHDGTDLLIHGEQKNQRVRIQLITFINKASTTSAPTTASVSTTRGFYIALLDAMRVQNRAYVLALLGNEYKSQLSEDQIIHYLFRNYQYARLENGADDQFDVIIDYTNGKSLVIHGNTALKHVTVNYITYVDTQTSSTTPASPVTTTQPWVPMTKETFYKKILKAVEKKDKEQIAVLLGDGVKSNMAREEYIEVLSRSYFNSTLKTLTVKYRFSVTFRYNEDCRVVIFGEQSEAGIRIYAVWKYNGVEEPQTPEATTTEAPSTTESAPVWLSMTRFGFYKKIVKAVDEKNKEKISDLIGNHFHAQLNREEIIEYLSHRYFNTSFKYFTKNHRFLVTFQYTDGSRMLVFGQEQSTTNSVRCIGIYRSEGVRTTATPAPPLVTTPQTFYLALLKALRSGDKQRIVELIGNKYKSHLTEEQILKQLFVKYRPSLKIFPNIFFKVSFEYPGGSILTLYGKSVAGKSVKIFLITLTKPTTTVAPTATTPCSISQQQKYLAKFHKTMGEWEASIYKKDVNHLSSLIDDNFKMTYDPEGTNSNKQRLIRSLMEGTFNVYTPQENLKVKIEDGLIRIDGKSKTYDVSLWFREEEKVLILVKAYLDKDVMKRKNALGFY